MPLHCTGAHQLQTAGGGCTCDGTFERSIGSGIAFGICSAALISAIYICMAGGSPANSDVVYTNSGCTTAYDGGGNWFRIGDGSDSYACQIDDSGIISNLSSC